MEAERLRHLYTILKFSATIRYVALLLAVLLFPSWGSVAYVGIAFLCHTLCVVNFGYKVKLPSITDLNDFVAVPRGLVPNGNEIVSLSGLEQLEKVNPAVRKHFLAFLLEGKRELTFYDYVNVMLADIQYFDQSKYDEHRKAATEKILK